MSYTAIVDYGVGNLKSLTNAMNYLGLPSRITSDRAELERAFSRSGFTDGYWLGKKGKAMFGTRPENVPEPKELFARARETYENGKENRRIPVNLRLTVRRGEPVRLGGACAVRNGVTIALATGDAPEEARNRAVTAEELRQRLTKTGGTVFAADQIEIELDEGLMVSASAVNALRRELLDELADRRMDTPKRRELPASPLPEAPADETPPISGSAIQNRLNAMVNTQSP